MTHAGIDVSFADAQQKGAYKLKNTELISHLFAAARHKIAVNWKQKEVPCLEERG